MARFQILIAFIFLVAGAAWLPPARAVAQDTGDAKDEALDSLLQKLDELEKDSASGADDAKPATDDDRKDKKTDDPKPADPSKGQSGSQAKSEPSKDGKKARDAEVSSGDKELDDLLEQLGETKDEPAPQERGGGRGGAGQDDPSGSGGDDGKRQDDKTKGSGLTGRDKEIDERLEELTGVKRRKNQQQQKEEGGGPLGNLVKEMRDVEERLGKPETGEDTQAKQRQIVKQIETLIEQAGQSGSSSKTKMVAQKTQAPGQNPGEQQSQNDGANPGGAPNAKPMKPSDRHAIAGGKDIWGHLPPELRQEMENVFKEDALPSQEELIRRYYLSVAKQKVARGE